MGARVCWGAFGVTLQIALGLMTRGFCAAGRELNLAPPPNASSVAPWCGFAGRWGREPTQGLNERAP